MKKARRALALLAFAAACGAPRPAPPPAPPPPPVDENLLALAPAAYSQVARVDLAALRGSPLWKLSELAMTDPTFAALRSVGEQDPLLLADELLLTGGDPASTGADEVLVLVKGRLDAEAIAAAFTARPVAEGEAAGPRLEAAALTGRTLAVGTHQAVAEATALARRAGRSLLDEAAFADFALPRDTAAAFRFRRGAEPLGVDRLRIAPLGKLAWGRNAISADGSLKIGAGVSAEIAFVLDDAEVAKRARRDLTRSLKRIAGNAIVRLMGVSNLLGRVAIAGENENVAVRALLGEAEVAQLQLLVDRFTQIRELMSGDDGGGGGEDDGPVELEPPMLERSGKVGAAAGARG